LLISSSASVVALSAAGTVGGAYWFYCGFRLFKRRRLLLNTPRSKIRSASMGLVEVSGLATGPAAITSPLRQVECFYYRSLAWELRQRGKNREWVKIADESLHVPFYIDDGTGRLLVDPRRAKMHLDCDVKGELGRPPLLQQGMPVGAGSFLSRHGANFSRRLRVAEYSIQPMNSLFVLGTLAENPVVSREPQAALRSDTRGGVTRPSTGSAGHLEIVRLSPDAPPQSATEMTQQQRVASALMKARVNHPAAWEPAEVNSENPVEARHYPASASEPAQAAVGRKADAAPVPSDFDPHPPVVMMKGTHDSPFMVSSRSQRDLARSIDWKSALAICAGPVLTLVSVSILLAHFHLG
jgi:hypothetical protein